MGNRIQIILTLLLVMVSTLIFGQASTGNFRKVRTDTLQFNLPSSTKVYYLKSSGDTIFLNNDTIIGSNFNTYWSLTSEGDTIYNNITDGITFNGLLRATSLADADEGNSIVVADYKGVLRRYNVPYGIATGSGYAYRVATWVNDSVLSYGSIYDNFGDSLMMLSESYFTKPSQAIESFRFSNTVYLDSVVIDTAPTYVLVLTNGQVKKSYLNTEQLTDTTFWSKSAIQGGTIFPKTYTDRVYIPRYLGIGGTDNYANLDIKGASGATAASWVRNYTPGNIAHMYLSNLSTDATTYSLDISARDYTSSISDISFLSGRTSGLWKFVTPGGFGITLWSSTANGSSLTLYNKIGTNGVFLASESSQTSYIKNTLYVNSLGIVNVTNDAVHDSVLTYHYDPELGYGLVKKAAYPTGQSASADSILWSQQLTDTSMIRPRYDRNVNITNKLYLTDIAVETSPDSILTITSAKEVKKALYAMNGSRTVTRESFPSDVSVGLTASSTPSEILEWLLFPFIQSTAEMSPLTTYVEVGKTTPVPMTLSVKLNSQTSGINGFIRKIYPSPITNILSLGTVTKDSVYNGLRIFSPTQTPSYLEERYRADIIMQPQTQLIYSDTLIAKGVYPYFTGMTTLNLTGGDSLLYKTLYKTIQPNTISDTAHFYTATAKYAYIAYPAVYPALAHIYDQNGFDWISTFTEFTSNVSTNNISPYPGWTNVSYRIYRSNNMFTTDSQTWTFEYTQTQ